MFQETVNQASFLIVLLDTQRRIVHLNPCGGRLLHLDPESVRNQSVETLVAHFEMDWRPRMKADWDRLLCQPQNGDPIMSRHLDPDGTPRQLCWSASEWLDADGHCRGTIVLAADISHCRRPDKLSEPFGEEAPADRLRPDEMERWYRTLFENTGTAMVILEQDLIIHSFNGEFVRLTGIPAEELRQKRVFRELVPDIEYERLVAYHKTRLAGGISPSEYEGELVTRRGGRKFVALKADVIPGTTRTIVSLIDVTRRKHAEKALQESQARMKRLLDNMPGMAYSIEDDDQRTISMVSRGALAFTGFDADDLVGNKFEDHFENHIHPEDVEKMRQAVDAAVESGQPFESVFRLKIASGEYKWVRNRGVGVYDEQGRLLRLEGLVTDIDTSKQAELELSRENQRLRSSIKDRFRFGQILGRSAPMQQVYEMILRAAASHANVIVYGESGTGKELVSRAIHDFSERRQQSFVPVNCGAIPENLLESEFFGYKKGAFTGAERDKSGFFELAHGGTLFLDEIGEIGASMQVKLLRAIEGGGYTPVGGKHVRKTDIRIIAATNRDMLKLVRDGKMREDFYYRIHIIPIHLPPLRDRREDIPLLVEHFLNSYGDEGRKCHPLPGNIMDQLTGYHWPGNVRELQNVLHRYVTLGRMDLEDVSAVAADGDDEILTSGSVVGETDQLAQAVAQFEKAFLLQQLQQKRWHVSRTAASLGINRRTLQRKMKRHGLY